MERKINIFRKVLILTFLAVGLVVIIESNKSICVSASTCDEAFANYLNANSIYEIARLSYFYGTPISCQQECNVPNPPPNCIANCQINRRTALGAAELNLFSNALNTCAPLTVDECAQARGMAEQCLIEHNYPSYSAPEEALAVYAQYSACRLASKVDSYQ